MLINYYAIATKKGILTYVGRKVSCRLRVHKTNYMDYITKYNPELLDKGYMVVLSKADLLDEELLAEYTEEMKVTFKEIPHLIISSATQFHLTELKDKLWKQLNP